MKPKADVLISLWKVGEVGVYIRIASTEPETIEQRINDLLKPFLADGVQISASIVPSRFS